MSSGTAIRRVPGAVEATWRDEVRQVRMRGVRAWWSVTLDTNELARRGEANVDCLAKLDVLDVLLSLPVELPVLECSLNAYERRTLATLSLPVVDRTTEGIMRLARPGLAVDHVLVPARSFRRGLESASTFSAYCTRSMVLPASACVDEFDLTEAAFFGVGVFRVLDGRLIELLAADRFDRCRETAASWAFSEVLWSRIRRMN